MGLLVGFWFYTILKIVTALHYDLKSRMVILLTVLLLLRMHWLSLVFVLCYEWNLEFFMIFKFLWEIALGYWWELYLNYKQLIDFPFLYMTKIVDVFSYPIKLTCLSLLIVPSVSVCVFFCVSYTHNKICGVHFYTYTTIKYSCLSIVSA